MSTEFVRAEGLTRRHRTPSTRLFAKPAVTTALDAVDLTLEEGHALGVIGESGSGKSTLVRLLLGLDRPTSGSVHIDGREVDASSSARSLRWLRRKTGIVFQDPYASLDPRMSVGRIVGEPLWALGVTGDRRARVREVLTQVGLDAAAADRFPREFSGGQRQRIALARGARWHGESPDPWAVRPTQTGRGDDDHHGLPRHRSRAEPVRSGGGYEGRTDRGAGRDLPRLARTGG